MKLKKKKPRARVKVAVEKAIVPQNHQEVHIHNHPSSDNSTDNHADQDLKRLLGRSKWFS